MLYYRAPGEPGSSAIPAMRSTKGTRENKAFRENAANHIALGRAYRFNLAGGEALSDDAFAAAGGNNSLIHFDCMIGSAEMGVDGVTEAGATEPVMRRGEWAFDV